MFYVTTDRLIALANGYIGEMYLQPKLLNDTIHQLLTGRVIKTYYIYYYGEPDQYLKDLFNYE